MLSRGAWAIHLAATCDGQGHGRAQTVSCVGLRIGVQDHDDGLGMGGGQRDWLLRRYGDKTAGLEA
jgi:hypothetical protein